jgi:hypothetical protein
MEIEYSAHLKKRLALRKIPYNLPEIIFRRFDEKYYDSETQHSIAIKKVKYFSKNRDMMIAYKKTKQKVVILTIHPLKKLQKDNRIKNKRWKKL